MVMLTIPLMISGIISVNAGIKDTQHTKDKYMKMPIFGRLNYLSTHALYGIPKTNLEVLKENNFKCTQSKQYQEDIARYGPTFGNFDEYTYTSSKLIIKINLNSDCEIIYDKRTKKEYKIILPTFGNPNFNFTESLNKTGNVEEKRRVTNLAQKELDKATKQVGEELNFQKFNIFAFIF